MARLDSIFVGLVFSFSMVNANAAIHTLSFETLTSGGVFAFLDFNDTDRIFTIRDNTANAFCLTPLV